MSKSIQDAGTPDQALVTACLLSIYIGVDLFDFDLSERGFAPTFLLDYTSIWGGQPKTITPKELTDDWRSFLPGFDASKHVISDLKVDVTGTTASATAEGDARLWLDGQLWRCLGHYSWSLEKLPEGWKVTFMRFDMTDEIGDRSLLTVDAKNKVAARRG